MVAFLLVAATFLGDPALTPGSPGGVWTVEQQWALLRATARVTAGEDQPPFGTAVCVAVKNDSAYLLTADHVLVRGEARIYDFYTEASYPKPSETIFDSDVVLRMPECDAALIRCKWRDRAPGVAKLAAWEKRPIRYPVQAAALGCPNGSAPQWRSDRVLARRYVRKSEDLGGFFWETETKPTGGMSGGPLFDTQGRLLGVCSAAHGTKGFFTHLDELLAALKRNGYGWVVE